MMWISSRVQCAVCLAGVEDGAKRSAFLPDRWPGVYSWFDEFGKSRMG